MKTQTLRAVAAACALALFSGAASAANLGPATEVAPGVKDSRQQVWPAAAWCESAKMWLVVWREGLLNEQETDIWCVRVSAEGKPLDPAGVRVTGAKGVQDHPSVASDGKGFFIVWEDLRSDKDYDVYGARVSAEGKVLDADGALVAGGEHNQCRPTVAFSPSAGPSATSSGPSGSGQAGGSYSVAWQGFAGDGLDGDGKTGYRIFGATVSTDGKAGSAAVLVDLSAPGMQQWAQPICPLVASTAKGAVLAFAQARNDLALYGVAMLPLAGAAGKPCWLSSLREWKASDPAPAALAWGNDAGVFVGRDNREITAWRLDASGQAGAPEPLLASPHPAKAHATPVMPHLGLAFDGERYLLVFEEMEVVGLAGGKVRVKGLHLPAAGKLKGVADQRQGVGVVYPR